MLGFNHTLSGSIIAIIVPAPLSPVVAFLSHFVFDAFPHFGRHPKITHGSPGLQKLIVADGFACLAALGLAIWLFPAHWFIIGLCSFLACLPDFVWMFKRQLRTPKWFLDFSTVIQWGERPWGWLLDLLYGAIFVAILLNLSY